MVKWIVLAGVALAMVAEGWVFAVVVGYVGLAAALAWIVFSFLLGLVLLRIEGVALLFQVHRQLQNGVVPTRELVDGALILTGALCLAAPGFLTDGIGLILLIRPARRLVVAGVMRLAARWGLGREIVSTDAALADEAIEIRAQASGRVPPG